MVILEQTKNVCLDKSWTGFGVAAQDLAKLVLGIKGFLEILFGCKMGLGKIMMQGYLKLLLL